jgi:formate C-acetyltransferase
VLKGSERVLCSERLRLITEFYKKNEELPILIKRAKALEYILSNMKIYIDPDELIVGNFTEELRGAPLFPEYSWKWIAEEIESFDKREQFRFRVPPHVKEDVKNYIPYWRGKTVEDRVNSLLPEKVKQALKLKIFDLARKGAGMGHHIANYEKILQRGFYGIISEIENERKKLKLSNPHDFKKLLFYEAALTVSHAAIKFAQRYAKLAEAMLKIEVDPNKRRNLEEIVRICKKVPAYPANTFREALQSVWFTYIIHQLESNGGAQALGRMDQYLYPYYKHDLEKGICTKQDIEDLLTCFFLKIYSVCKLYSNEGAAWHGGEGVWGKCITLGGVTKENEDASNELSYIFLDVATRLSLPQPDIAVILSDKTPDDFIIRVIEALKTNAGAIKLFNNGVVVSALQSLGASIEDARNWGSLGCADPAIVGCMNTEADGGPFNLAKCLEITLNDGVDPVSGVRIAPSFGGINKITTIDELKEKYKRTLGYFVELYVTGSNIVDLAHMELVPTPFLSILIDDCLKLGLDFTEGGSRYNTGCVPVATGLATVADSLAAIQKVVFEEKLISLPELQKILNRNFQGAEELRLSLLLKAPKYGNDDDAVDSLASWVFNTFNELLRQYSGPRGEKCPYVGGWFPMTSHIPCGKNVGATPDGRRAGEPLSENICPVWGRNLKGPTAVLKSVAKLDQVRGYGGILNITLSPSLFNSDSMKARILSFIKSWLDLNIWHIQFNVLSVEMLKDAQKFPAKYPNLLVRVSGFSAYFTDLSKELQDTIIQRTEYGLV